MGRAPDRRPAGAGCRRVETEGLAVADAVHRALGDLSRVNRDALVLRYYAQLSEQETALVLGIPVGTVKSRVSRALSQLAGNAHLNDFAEGFRDG
jgi:RNA polymerase sigma factor (sigma-70 family)